MKISRRQFLMASAITAGGAVVAGGGAGKCVKSGKRWYNPGHHASNHLAFTIWASIGPQPDNAGPGR
jgi:phosphodiesterase/alkaline phosphatase D-like protein